MQIRIFDQIFEKDKTKSVENMSSYYGMGTCLRKALVQHIDGQGLQQALERVNNHISRPSKADAP